MRTSYAELPLHRGKAPRWLFNRMVKLSECIAEIIIREYGAKEFLRKLSDAYWFQALACVLGFDWHSSGTTTTTCGALKLALKGNDYGIFIAGGKGRASRKTIEEIEKTGESINLSDRKIEKLKKASRLAAKVDNACVQDNYELYHHAFFFTEDASFAIVQQGMHIGMGKSMKLARRYHWLSNNIASFVNEPHSAIAGEKEKKVLNMVAEESKEARKASVDIANDNALKYIKAQATLSDFSEKKAFLKLPHRHEILKVDISKRTMEALKKAYEIQPKDYEELISLRGIGAKSIRALALISELIYGKKPSYKDPVKFSFAHGGKDGYPYPVNKKVYDKSIEILKDAIKNAEIGREDKMRAIRSLHRFIGD